MISIIDAQLPLQAITFNDADIASVRNNMSEDIESRVIVKMRIIMIAFQLYI